MTLKTRLTELLHIVRDQQLAFADQLSSADRQENGTADHWSAKDTVVHGIVWADRKLADLETVEGGEAAPVHNYGDFVDENEAIFEAYRDTSWADVQDMVGKSFARLDAYLDRVGENGLAATTEGRPYAVWREIAGSYISHPTFHEWVYLQERGYDELQSTLLGESFTTRMIDLHEDEEWRGEVLYNLACQYALAGDSEQAIANLDEALRLSPGLSEWSLQDSDLASLRDDPAYRAIYED